jgi:hypothetical protein
VPLCAMDRYSTSSVGVSVNRDDRLDFALIMLLRDGDLDLFSIQPLLEVRRNVAIE